MLAVQSLLTVYEPMTMVCGFAAVEVPGCRPQMLPTPSK
jgi:hypothetical protein